MTIDLDAITRASPVGQRTDTVDTAAFARRSPNISYFPGDLDNYNGVASGDLACGKASRARRKDRVLIRRGRAFTVGLGDPLGAADSPSTSPVAVRSNFGVETLQKTARLYRSTTPRANRIRPKSDNFLHHQP